MDWLKIGLIASIVSILGSIGIYIIQDETLGIFIGLWASAILLISERLNTMAVEKESFKGDTNE